MSLPDHEIELFNQQVRDLRVNGLNNDFHIIDEELDYLSHEFFIVMYNEISRNFNQYQRRFLDKYARKVHEAIQYRDARDARDSRVFREGAGAGEVGTAWGDREEAREAREA